MTYQELCAAPKNARFECLSGLGGTFTVRVLQLTQQSDGSPTARVRVQLPGNPDWHGHEFSIAGADLFPFGTPQRAMYQEG